jgi:hypothetical protein
MIKKLADVAEAAGKALTYILKRPVLTVGTVGAAFATPWIVDKAYKATMLKSQLKENKDNELLRLIATNTANKKENERKPLIKNLS